MRVTIIQDVDAAPDHNHTRKYKKGEQFVLDSPLMPRGLATILVENKCALIEDRPLDAEWKEVVDIGIDEKGKPWQKTRHQLMHDALFAHDRVLDW